MAKTERHVIKLKSRYGDTHQLVPFENGDSKAYRLCPAFDWMPIYIDFHEDENGKKEISAVDTDGGPKLYVGSPVGREFEVEKIYESPGGSVIVNLVPKKGTKKATANSKRGKNGKFTKSDKPKD